MACARWIVPWADSETKPAIYHCIARVVDRRFAFEPEDKEQFRMYMRMMENFSGCRVLAYCVMCNHFHLLLEVPPKPKRVLTDEQLLKRLGALYSKALSRLWPRNWRKRERWSHKGWRGMVRPMCNASMNASPTGCMIYRNS